MPSGPLRSPVLRSLRHAPHHAVRVGDFARQPDVRFCPLFLVEHGAPKPRARSSARFARLRHRRRHYAGKQADGTPASKPTRCREATRRGKPPRALRERPDFPAEGGSEKARFTRDDERGPAPLKTQQANTMSRSDETRKTAASIARAPDFPAEGGSEEARFTRDDERGPAPLKTRNYDSSRSRSKKRWADV